MKRAQSFLGAVAPLTRKGNPALRVPALETGLSDGDDKVVFENYDDQDFGYLRILVDTEQLRIEYHPSSDGDAAKTPDDFVTVDLAKRRLIHYQIPGETGEVKPARTRSRRRRTR